MATTPPPAKSAQYGSRLVFHPNIPADEVKRANKAVNWKLGAVVLGAGHAMVIAVTVGFALMVPSMALLSFTTLAIASIVLAVIAYRLVIKPYVLRRKLLSMGSALWLAPGKTRFFYEQLLERITNHVDAHHRHGLLCDLHWTVRQMLNKERIAGGDDSLLMGDRTENTSEEALAEYEKFRAHLSAQVDRYVNGRVSD